MTTIDQRLQQLHIILPQLSAPVANYLPYRKEGNHVYISGQLPLGIGNTQDYVGKLGKEFTIEQGQHIARICGLNILAQLKNACNGDLERVEQCIKLGAFVHCTDTFTDHPKVVNGVSDLMVEVFGEQGKHARFAVGVNQLPLGMAVEVEALFRIR